MLKHKPKSTITNHLTDRIAPADDTLLAYSKGLLSRRDALQRLGMRDSADLLVALGDAGLPLPPSGDVDSHVATFVRLWNAE